MAKTIKLDDRVRDILARSSMTATSLALPGQLERADYDRVMKAIKAAGGKWDRKAGHHVFGRDPREALGLAISTGEVTNTKQLLQAFYTPDALADRVVALLDPQPGELVLEPSCGEGALVLALYRREPTVRVDCIDVDPVALARARARVGELNNGPATFDARDFLAMPAEPVYSAIVMNPPFSGDADIAHVRAAWNWLRPGGRLVAITSVGWTQTDRGGGGRQTRAEFRGWLEGLGVEVETIEAGAFASSGTQVASVLLRVAKLQGVADA